MKRYPHSQGEAVLTSRCQACGYGQGIVIIRFKDDPGFVRCGRCDSPQYAVVERVEEVAS